MESQLEEKLGKFGLEYLLPQLDIVRSARNLPSILEDYRLSSQKFFESYQIIQKWLAPVVVPITDQLTEVENRLQELQYQMKYHLQEEDIVFWNDVIRSSNPTIKSLYPEIINLREYITKQRESYLQTAQRDILPELLGLILWAYTELYDLKSAVNEVKQRYFGPNSYYKKNNILTDALILNVMCDDVLRQRKGSSTVSGQIEQLVEGTLTFDRINEQLEWAKFKRNPDDGAFKERQIRTIVKALLPKMSSSEAFRGINTFYDPSRDSYPIRRFLEWLSSALRQKGLKSAEIKEVTTGIEKTFLIGLSFMDKHRRQEILGNITPELAETFDRILVPFHELKQDNAFMQSAQFEIENVLDLPSQAWIYDYTGVETEILRSTLLLISDRQPKFDVLEACQRLANIILSGRVDRNDFKRGNYVITNKLPPRIWDSIGNQLLAILEEALVREETLTVQIIKNIFQDEDRSSLVTSKKFIPVFLVQTDFKYDRSRGYQPQTMSVWVREDFKFQYRFAQVAGYPWYYMVNSLLESLVVNALEIPSFKIIQIHENVKIRQTVYTIDDETYIIYYGAQGEGISALAFKETDLTNEEGIDPVEVIFRPHKFLGLGPEKNNLNLLLENARATDPKDLMTIIASL